MRFDDKELEVMINKNIDKIVFESKGQKVFFINIEELIKKRIETDPNLKKQLLSQVLQSEE